MKFLISVLLLIPFWSLSTTQIFGSAQNSIGEWIYLYEIEEFFTKSERYVQKFKTTEKNRFYFEVENKEVKRYVIRLNNSYSELYLEPNGTYKIVFPEESVEVIPYFSGREMELLFLELDSTDINYKILGFEAWLDDEFADLYLLKDVEPTKFIDGVLKFKMEVLAAYKDEESEYFKNHIKYVLGKTIDNINYFGGPNELEKFNFYIRDQEVLYNLPSYIDYFQDFYSGIRLKLNERSKQGVLIGLNEANGEVLIRGLLSDSIVPNIQIAEMVALEMMKSEYPKGNIPQNNLIKLAKFIELNSGHETNKIIAKNLQKQFYSLAAGDPLPTIYLKDKSVLGNTNKYQYIHFFDPSNPKSLAETFALKSLYDKYKNDIDFVTIYLESKSRNKGFKQRVLQEIIWPVYGLSYYHPIWKTLNVGTFPYYVLINKELNIESIPALGPIPNGVYETIDKTFHELLNK